MYVEYYYYGMGVSSTSLCFSPEIHPVVEYGEEVHAHTVKPHFHLNMFADAMENMYHAESQLCCRVPMLVGHQL